MDNTGKRLHDGNNPRSGRGRVVCSYIPDYLNRLINIYTVYGPKIDITSIDTFPFINNSKELMLLVYFALLI